MKILSRVKTLKDVKYKTIQVQIILEKISQIILKDVLQLKNLSVKKFEKIRDSECGFLTKVPSYYHTYNLYYTC